MFMVLDSQIDVAFGRSTSTLLDLLWIWFICRQIHADFVCEYVGDCHGAGLYWHGKWGSVGQKTGKLGMGSEILLASCCSVGFIGCSSMRIDRSGALCLVSWSNGIRNKSLLDAFLAVFFKRVYLGNLVVDYRNKRTLYSRF